MAIGEDFILKSLSICGNVLQCMDCCNMAAQHLYVCQRKFVQIIFSDDYLKSSFLWQVVLGLPTPSW